MNILLYLFVDPGSLDTGNLTIKSIEIDYYLFSSIGKGYNTLYGLC